jgi:hypothetical protein
VTLKKPNRPLTGKGGTLRTLAKIQAHLSGTCGAQLARASSGRNGRESTTSTMQRATPVGSSPTFGRLAAQISRGPRYLVVRERASMGFPPLAILLA